MVEMELLGVRVELPANVPIVLLREQGGQGRVLPIYIGGPEATAIVLAVDKIETPRPMTHDLMKNILDEIGATVDKVVVTELSESTFYAEIHLTLGEKTYRISSRPSDAIALAIRTGTPIFAEEEVLDEAGTTASMIEGEDDSEEVVEQFREFIERVNPEDFAS
ncbi:MAG: hypothetical protein KatS3mg008_0292 [Acidimicrobiales bacterium]|nr:MAG: hypothetical protein KatS3mg008_0292 [Acidimicrobiales bacterium]